MNENSLKRKPTEITKTTINKKKSTKWQHRNMNKIDRHIHEKCE